MNTCFRVADQLADSLRCLSSGFSEAEVLPLLSEFDARFEQELTPRLAENHAAGLQMDTITGGGFVALQEQLHLAAGDERILNAMALKAAGLIGYRKRVAPAHPQTLSPAAFSAIAFKMRSSPAAKLSCSCRAMKPPPVIVSICNPAA